MDRSRKDKPFDHPAKRSVDLVGRGVQILGRLLVLTPKE